MSLCPPGLRFRGIVISTKVMFENMQGDILLLSLYVYPTGIFYYISANPQIPPSQSMDKYLIIQHVHA